MTDDEYWLAMMNWFRAETTDDDWLTTPDEIESAFVSCMFSQFDTFRAIAK